MLCIMDVSMVGGNFLENFLGNFQGGKYQGGNFQEEQQEEEESFVVIV